MAMIFCPRCGKQISDKAPVCPHCNSQNPMFHGQQPQAPVSQPSPAPNKSKLPVIIVILLVIAIGAAVATPIYLKKNKSDNSSTNETQVFTNQNPVNESIVPKEDTTKFSFAETEANSSAKSTEASAESEKCKVKLQFTSEDQTNPTRTYDTNVYFDGEIICTLEDGEVKNNIPVFYVERGIHTIRFEKTANPPTTRK